MDQRNSNFPRKDNEKSELSRKLAGDFLCKNDTDSALVHFNEAIRLAECNTDTLYLALAGRAQIALQWNNTMGAIQDLRQAIAISESINQKTTELSKPTVEFHQKLVKRLQSAEKQLKKSPKAPKIADCELFKGEHSQINGMSSAISIDYDPIKGRQLVANQHIPAGALIIRDQPLAWEILAEFAELICLNCCQPLQISWLPCENCSRSQIRFCNSDCRSAAWQRFHKFECEMGFGFHSGLQEMPGQKQRNSNARLIAQRVLTATSPDQLLKYDPKLPENKSEIAQFGIKDGQQYTSNFQSAMSLMSKEDAKLKLTSKVLPFSSVSSVKFLSQENWPESLNEDEKKLKFSLRLMNELNNRIRCNSWGIKVIFPDGTLQDVGSAFYTTGSLLNHSCLPNVCESFNGKVAEWRTNESIEKGTELCTTYCPHFGQLPRQQRIQHLLQGYGFECGCDACTQPKYLQMENDLFGFACASCKQTAQEDPLTGSIMCEHCGVLPYTGDQVRDAADAIKMETERRVAEDDCEVKDIMQLLKKLEPMVGKRSELQFQLRATVAKCICECNAKFAVAIIDQLFAQRQQFYGDVGVMTWMNAPALSVHFMVDSRSERTRQMMTDEVRRLLHRTGASATRVLLNAVPDQMKPSIMATFDRLTQ